MIVRVLVKESIATYELDTGDSIEKIDYITASTLLCGKDAEVVLVIHDITSEGYEEYTSIPPARVKPS